MARILIADDERALRESIRKLLAGEGYEVKCAKTGDEALEIFSSGVYDLVILDIDMPGKNGYAVCREIRRLSRLTPVLFLTANDSESNQVRALGAGADDFIAKDGCSSYSDWAAIFLARVRRSLERGEEYERTSNVVKIGAVSIDLGSLDVVSPDGAFRITRTEADIVRLLSSEPNRYFTKDEIIAALRGSGYACEDGMVYTHISNLRRKLGRAGSALMCDRRSGYKLTV